jgi:hypothetical protein
MDPEKYQQIYNYLTTQQIPEILTQAKEIKKFKNFCKHFYIKNNFVYKKDKRKEENLLRVIRRFEMEPVLYMMHTHPTAGHFSVEIMFNKIRNRYFWPKMYEDIREYIKTCDACQRRGKASDNQRLHPIPVYTPFYQIGIDFVGPLPQTNLGNKYIIVAMDYLTKWPEARAVPRATAEETTKFIYEEIICRHGCPQKILTDRGTHFKNQLVENLMQKFEIQHLLSTPYHPQTNGLVERFNRTLCESLAKLSKQKEDWDQYVAPTLFAYRSATQSTTKMTPFMLTYGREARLSSDITAEDGKQGEEVMYDRLQTIINHLPIVRETARQQIQIQQQKQKDRHDQHLKKEVKFQIGEKVLLYDAKKEKQWTGKFDDKWKGPYYIHSVGRTGSYKLRELTGQVIATPYNGKLLKLYRDRLNWEPTIVITS